MESTFSYHTDLENYGFNAKFIIFDHLKKEFPAPLSEFTHVDHSNVENNILITFFMFVYLNIC